MTSVTFSRLRDSEDWGLRGSKELPTDLPPQEGSMVTVTKKSGETQDVQMGRVIAQGDDWWLATVGASNNTTVCKACPCETCLELRRRLQVLLNDPEVREAAAFRQAQEDRMDDADALEDSF